MIEAVAPEVVVAENADAVQVVAEVVTKPPAKAAVKTQNKIVRSAEDALSFSRENMEAIVKASSIFARGIQDLSNQVLGLHKEAVDEAVSASRQIMSAKSIKEAMDLQSGMAKTGFDKALAESTRLSGLSVKLVEEAIAPINDRVSQAVGRLSKSA